MTFNDHDRVLGSKFTSSGVCSFGMRTGEGPYYGLDGVEAVVS